MVGVGGRGTVGQEKRERWGERLGCLGIHVVHVLHVPGIQKIEGFGWLEQYIDLRHKKRRQKFLMALEQAAHLGDADAQCTSFSIPAPGTRVHK
jgi:hypothetical protein